MQVSTQNPPFWDRIRAAFELDGMDVVFTHGNVIYNPNNLDITTDLLRHEETHAAQQEHNSTVATLWWERYLSDPDFRLQAETEAYGEQYKFLCAQHKDKNTQARYLYALSAHLSGPMYGNIIGQEAAMRRILDYASGKALRDFENE